MNRASSGAAETEFRSTDGDLPAWERGEMRPRNRRTTPGSSRGVSPVLAEREGKRAERDRDPRRAERERGETERNRDRDRDTQRDRQRGGLTVPDSGRASARSISPASSPGLGGLFEGGWASSWNAIQGLASSVLAPEEGGSEGLGRRRKEKPRRAPDTWGPSGTPRKPGDVIGAGSVAERGAAVRALKMRGLLEGREEDLNVRKDTNGKYKRRTSVEDTARLRDDDGDALVYIHHVQPEDTLAGVVLRYNCQPAVFRKANRLWPNDSIQIRKIVVLPVDACTVKGRPCDPPSPPELRGDGGDLLAPTPEKEDPNSFNNGSTWPGSSSLYSVTSTEQQDLDDHPWTHVRWVLFDSSPASKPVEIARMPRQTLGYFPPRRRKSQATISSVSSPRGSSEFPPFSLTSNELSGSPSSTASRRTSNFGIRSTPGSYFPPSTPKTRPRGESVGEVAERLGWMRGPGGVGTFSKNVRRPGPAQDGLNSWAKKHIPGLAIDSLPSVSLVGGDSARFSITDEVGGIEDGPMRPARSGTATPSGAGQGLGLENAAAAIEGWVRRLATIKPGTPRVGGAVEGADLIELLDGTGSDDGRGFELSPGMLRVPGSSGREDLDGLARGRATAGSKGGKGD